MNKNLFPFIFILLFFVSSFFNPNSIGSDFCGEEKPKTGLIENIEGIEFGNPIKFWNEQNDGTDCFPVLIMESKYEWIWMWRYSIVNGIVYGSICKEEISDFKVEPGMKYGTMERDIKKVTLYPGNNRKPTLTESGIPDFTLVSNPSQCGRFIAYWRTTSDNRTFASVYDLIQNKIIKEKLTSVKIPGTGFEDHLPKPSWSGQKVIFCLDYKCNEPVSFVINEVTR